MGKKTLGHYFALLIFILGKIYLWQEVHWWVKTSLKLKIGYKLQYKKTIDGVNVLEKEILGSQQQFDNNICTQLWIWRFWGLFCLYACTSKCSRPNCSCSPIKRPAIQDVAMCYSFLDHSVRVGLFGYDRKVGRIVFYYPMILRRLERMRNLDSKLPTSPIFPVTLLCCLGLGPNLVSRSVRTGMGATPQPSVGWKGKIGLSNPPKRHTGGSQGRMILSPTPGGEGGDKPRRR